MQPEVRFPTSADHRGSLQTSNPHRLKKKPGSIEPGLRFWPCEADTITFQEG
jgi:hypothetical protein